MIGIYLQYILQIKAWWCLHSSPHPKVALSYHFHKEPSSNLLQQLILAEFTLPRETKMVMARGQKNKQELFLINVIILDAQIFK